MANDNHKPMSPLAAQVFDEAARFNRELAAMYQDIRRSMPKPFVIDPIKRVSEK